MVKNANGMCHFFIYCCCGGFYVWKNIYRFLVQLFAIINLNDMHPMCTYTYSSHQYAHIHLPIVAYKYMGSQIQSLSLSLALFQMVLYIYLYLYELKAVAQWVQTLLPRNIPFANIFTTHQNRFMCVLDTNTHFLSVSFIFILTLPDDILLFFWFYSIEHVLSQRCTIKSD